MTGFGDTKGIVHRYFPAPLSQISLTPAEKRAILGKATGDDGRGCPEPREEMPAGCPVIGDKSVECFQIQVEPRTV